MKYRLNKTLVKMKKEEKPKEDVLLAEILSPKEFCTVYGNSLEGRMLQRDMLHVGYCKADLVNNHIIGTLSVPSKKNLLESFHTIGFYLEPSRLLLVDESDFVSGIFDKLEKDQMMEKNSISRLFFEFMEYLLKDDVHFLQDYESRMTDIEDELYQDKIKDCPAEILKIRRELLKLNSYYEQLVDISETLEEYHTGFLNGVDGQLFHMLAERAGRMSSNVKNLREYTLQLREMHQTKTTERQNKIMQFLTVVTTIFMPLTLLTGWYGMNFNNMPELRLEGSYFVLMLISLLIILVEILYFRHKNWFD